MASAKQQRDRSGDQLDGSTMSDAVKGLIATTNEINKRLDKATLQSAGQAREFRDTQTAMLALLSRVERSLMARSGTRQPQDAATLKPAAAAEYSECRSNCMTYGNASEVMACSSKCICETQCRAESDPASCAAYCARRK